MSSHHSTSMVWASRIIFQKEARDGEKKARGMAEGGEVGGWAVVQGGLSSHLLGVGCQADHTSHPVLPHRCASSSADHWSWRVPSGKWVRSGCGQYQDRKVKRWCHPLTSQCSVLPWEGPRTPDCHPASLQLEATAFECWALG